MYWRRRRPRLRLTFALGFVGQLPAVDVRIYNAADRPVTVAELGFEAQPGGGVAPTPDPRIYETPLPATLASFGELSLAIPPDGFVRGSLDLDKPIVAWVRLAGGRVVRSKPYTLGPGRQQHAGVRRVG